jgi:hypothetical protein
MTRHFPGVIRSSHTVTPPIVVSLVHTDGVGAAPDDPELFATCARKGGAASQYIDRITSSVVMGSHDEVLLAASRRIGLVPGAQLATAELTNATRASIIARHPRFTYFIANSLDS